MDQEAKNGSGQYACAYAYDNEVFFNTGRGNDYQIISLAKFLNIRYNTP